jgi:hypothetical protein
MLMNADGAQASAGDLVRVTCPRSAVTRIVLPGRLVQMQGDSHRQRALGMTVERTRPRGVLRVEPRGHAGAALVELRGPAWRLRLALQTVDGTRARTLELDPEHARPNATPPLTPAPIALPSPPALPSNATAARLSEVAPSPGDKPVPMPPATEPGTVTPTPNAPAPSPPPASAPSPSAQAASVAFDVRALLRAKRVRLGRQEGLPGQRRMTLVEALHDDTLVWLRFTLGDGATERVASVAWERGTVSTFTQEAVGAHLQVVVQLPRVAVSRRTRVTLALASGAEYRFALNSGTLADLFRSPF